MPRGTPKRLTALLGAVLLLLTVAGEGFGLHPCPYHASDSTTETELPAPADQHSSSHHSGSAPGHHSSAVDPGDSSPAESDRGEHHSGADPCTHFEACQSAAGAIVPTGVVAVEIASPRAEPIARIDAMERSLPTPPSFLLPYGQAPPARG